MATKKNASVKATEREHGAEQTSEEDEDGENKRGQKKLTEAEVEALFADAMQTIGPAAENLSLSYDEKGKCSILRTRGKKTQILAGPLASNTFARLMAGAKLFAQITQEQ